MRLATFNEGTGTGQHRNAHVDSGDRYGSSLGEVISVSRHQVRDRPGGGDFLHLAISGHLGTPMLHRPFRHFPQRPFESSPFLAAPAFVAIATTATPLSIQEWQVAIQISLARLKHIRACAAIDSADMVAIVAYLPSVFPERQAILDQGRDCGMGILTPQIA